MLTPLEPLDLPEHLRVLITIQVPTAEGPEDAFQRIRNLRIASWRIA